MGAVPNRLPTGFPGTSGGQPLPEHGGGDYELATPGRRRISPQIPERLFTVESHPFGTALRNPKLLGEDSVPESQNFNPKNLGSVPSEGTPGGIAVGVHHGSGAAQSCIEMGS